MITSFVRVMLFAALILGLSTTRTPAQQPGKLIVFVGEKIASSALAASDSMLLDHGARFRYRILTKIYGDYTRDTIEFKAFDHYGAPPFSSYEHVLLFVTQYGEEFYHEKYQYFDVYKTKDGSWASPGDPYRFDSNTNVIQSRKKYFVRPVKFELKNGHLKNVVNIAQLSLTFNEPYFKMIGDNATAYFGTDVIDLFQLKREGVLKARGFF